MTELAGGITPSQLGKQKIVSEGQEKPSAVSRSRGEGQRWGKEDPTIQSPIPSINLQVTA